MCKSTNTYFNLLVYNVIDILTIYKTMVFDEGRKYFLFNDVFNTFYVYMVKDHSDAKEEARCHHVRRHIAVNKIFLVPASDPRLV